MQEGQDVAAHPPPPPGWFGKIATLGDFAQRRWPAHVVRTCDAWLSQAMHMGPSRLGDRWWPTYLTAPLLRFAWMPGVVDEAWWFGVLMPSCDDVGRYFPLVVSTSRPAPPADAEALQHLDRWHAHVSEAATATLAGASLDAFEASLHRAPSWPRSGPRPGFDAAGHSRSDAFHLRMSQGTVADATAQQRSGLGFWWRDALGHPDTRTWTEAGLPRGERFADLLDRIVHDAP